MTSAPYRRKLVGECALFESISNQRETPSPPLSRGQGPQQTAAWPLVWGDLDPANLPGWVTFGRTCQHSGIDGQPCPRRWAGSYFGVRHCDRHVPNDLRMCSAATMG